MSDEKETVIKCERCGVEPAREQHVCPFEYAIHDDAETLCNCCYTCDRLCEENI